MQTKTIDKLRELDGFIWGEEKENILESIYCEDIDGTELQFKRNIKNIDGNYEIVNMFEISEKNLDELEFYGLKVILNEKPKLTSGEKYIIECIDGEIWLARNKDGSIMMFSENPEVFKMTWSVDIEHSLIPLNPELFKFITWESGKAWSKAELMELEVVD